MIQNIFKRLMPVAAMTGALLVSGCDGMNVQIGTSDGVPLAELDMSGPAPTELVLAGPDTVIVSEGDALDIDVTGEQKAVDAMRFEIDGDSLTISRESDDWSDSDGIANVRVTMPSLSALTLAGSGDVEAAAMSGDPDVTIAGSGKAKIASLSGGKLGLTIAGSGDFEASGQVESLDMTIAGSGSANMPGLKVGGGDITVAGSGGAEFASDGDIEATIMGSGTVTVNGRANCTITSMGSGELNCRTTTEASADANETPDGPETPETTGEGEE